MSSWRLLGSSAPGVHHGRRGQLVSYSSSSTRKRGWSRRGPVFQPVVHLAAFDGPDQKSRIRTASLVVSSRTR
jgi:hypothetical protein